MSHASMKRRDFARLFAFGGSAALFGHPSLKGFRPGPLSNSSLRPAVDWNDVRAQFLMPPDVSVLNAANLCPSPARVLETVVEYTERLNREPVPSYRSEMGGSKAGSYSPISYV